LDFRNASRCAAYANAIAALLRQKKAVGCWLLAEGRPGIGFRGLGKGLGFRCLGKGLEFRCLGKGLGV
jgi:hypothetical protein